MIHMKPNGATWRHGRARKDLSAKDAAKRLFIAHRYLLNIETNQPGATPSMRLVYRAANLYGLTYAELVIEDEDKPAGQPAEQPAREGRPPDPSSPPPRRKDDRKGPPRTDLKQAS